jgi:hypothetical protein
MKQTAKALDKRLIIAILSTLPVALCLWIISMLLPKEPLVDATRRLTDCVAAGNSDCVFDLMLESERKTQGVTRSQLRTLFQDYVLPTYEEDAGAPTRDILTLKDQGEVIAISKWSRKGRPPAVIAMNVAATPDGPRSVNTIRNIILHTIDAKYRKTTGEAAILVDLEGMIHDGQRLSDLGFRGIYDPKKDAVDDWSTIITSLRRNAVDHGLLKGD